MPRAGLLNSEADPDLGLLAGSSIAVRASAGSASTSARCSGAQEIEQNEAQGVHGRVDAANDDGLDQADELGPRQACTLLVDLHDLRQQVVAGPA